MGQFMRGVNADAGGQAKTRRGACGIHIRLNLKTKPETFAFYFFRYILLACATECVGFRPVVAIAIHQLKT